MDEARGNVKYSVGKMSGNRDMEAEGKTEHDAAVVRRHIKGAANQIKGNVEEGLGNIIDADRRDGDTERA